MKRKKFLKTSLLAFGGMTALPVLAHKVEFNSLDQVKLKINTHIRHGYYGKEFVVNHIESELVESIRIDKFDNPEGDMLLIDLQLQNENIRLAFNKNELFIEKDSEIHEIDLNEDFGSLSVNDDRIKIYNSGINDSNNLYEKGLIIDQEKNDVVMVQNPSSSHHGFNSNLYLAFS